MTRRPTGLRGFTLIEVLVALAIVAVTIGAGIKAAGSLTSNTARLVDVTAAQWCADNRLSALKLAHVFPDVGDGDFSCDQLGRSYAGKLVVRPTPNPNFRRVDARMYSESGDSILTLSTIAGRN
ncbi:MAG: type II secretion system minor pseudopilin GspI [Pseudomonadota bacterium]|nr:type II secretion system minor pseudopilin GspI [Pseudomonadota bacterium]